MERKAVPGTPWEGEISLGNFSGAPPEDINDFFRPLEAPGAFREPPGEAPGAHLALKRALEASGSQFGTQIDAKMEPRGLIFEQLLAFISAVFSCPRGPG